MALHEAKNRLSALIAEIQESGEEVVITRHGKPAARVLPVDPEDDREARRAVAAYVIARRNERAVADPRSRDPLSWEELKREGDEDRP